MAKHFSRNDLPELQKPKIKEIEIGDYCYLIRKLQQYDNTKFQLDIQNKVIPPELIQSVLISMSIVDDNNELVMDVDEAKKLDSDVANRLSLEIVDLNGFNPKAVEEAREQLKNESGDFSEK